MAEFSALTDEWAEILDGTLAYLRAQAAAELDYATVMRIERTALRRARAFVSELEGEAPQATDELLRQATDVEPVRQAVTEQVAAAPVDDGPEGMADDANRELSEEISEEPPEMDIEELMEPDTAEEDVEDADTAPPGASTPMPTVRAADTPVAAAPTEPDTFEEELDLDAIEEIPDTEAELEPLDLDAELEEMPAPPSSAGPLLPDFDFDDDSDEQDETVVFALGAEGGMDTGDAVARLLEEHEAAEAAKAGGDDDSFDLMPELEVDELELEELELESVDEPGELEIEPLTLDDDTDMGGEGPKTTGGGASARVTAGLYGNPNVPTIRETPGPAPRAAAIQINASAGTGKMMGFEEEEEPLEIGAAEDYDEDYEDDASAGGGGFSLSIAEDDYDDEEEWEDDDSEEEVASAAPAPVYTGPDLSQVASLLAQAQEAAVSGDMQGGVDLFSDVLDMDPDRVQAYVGRGRLYLDLGDYSRAMSDFMTAEELEENNPEPQVAIGDLYFARKDYRKAIDYFNGALAMDPNHAMAHCRRGISHYYRKNYSDALKDLKTAEGLDPDIPNIGTYISMAKKKAKR